MSTMTEDLTDLELEDLLFDQAVPFLRMAAENVSSGMPLDRVPARFPMLTAGQVDLVPRLAETWTRRRKAAGF